MVGKVATMEHLLRLRNQESVATDLSAREIAVLGHLASGARLAAIGELLGVRKNNAGDSVTSAVAKMGVLTSTHAVAEAIHYGILVRARDGAWIPNPLGTTATPYTKKGKI